MCTWLASVRSSGSGSLPGILLATLPVCGSGWLRELAILATVGLNNHNGVWAPIPQSPCSLASSPTHLCRKSFFLSVYEIPGEIAQSMFKWTVSSVLRAEIGLGVPELVIQLWAAGSLGETLGCWWNLAWEGWTLSFHLVLLEWSGPRSNWGPGQSKCPHLPG